MNIYQYQITYVDFFCTVLKTQYARQEKIAPENIFSVAVMPCIAKKYETVFGAGEKCVDTDAVITLIKLIKLIKYT